MVTTIAKVVAALCVIESENNPTAVGDLDPRTGEYRAVGILQVWPVALREANRVEAIEARLENRQARVWTLDDRLDPDASREMCAVTLRWHYRRGVTDPVDLAARWRNPDGKMVAWYREKVSEQLNGRA